MDKVHDAPTTEVSAVNEIVESKKERRGFALLSPERRKEISSKGGKRAHEIGKAHRWTADQARNFGSVGGSAPHRSRGRKAA